MNLNVFIGVILLFFAIEQAQAVPEAIRYGQFSCTSCHVSPGGAGSLTSYGREFAAEKLSTWTSENAENPVHGLLPLSDRFVLGGDVRSVYFNRKTEGLGSSSKYWLMNADLEAAANFGPLWLSLTGGMEPRGPSGSGQEFEGKFRGYFARVDLLDDHLSIRGGLFTPKFGLMLSDHTNFVRQASKLPADPEQTQIETIFLTDRFEATLALLVENKSFDREGKSKSGTNIGISGKIGKSRINLNVMKTKLSLESTSSEALVLDTSGVLTFSNKWYGMYEILKTQNSSKTTESTIKKDELANYFSINYELKKGFIPYVRYEFWDTDLSTKNTSVGRWGAGFMWYPRPHFQFEGKYSRAIINSAAISVNEATGIFHYYF
jgi:hypothetical protein